MGVSTWFLFFLTITHTHSDNENSHKKQFRYIGQGIFATYYAAAGVEYNGMSDVKY